MTGLVVLLIACVNVANLLLAKGMSRRRELAVRAALGAGRDRLIRQSLAENLVLGAAGGGLGLVGASFGISGIGAALAANEPGRVPRLEQYLESGLDGQVLLFALVASIGAVLLFGLLPALQTTRSLRGTLQEGGRGSGAGVSSRRLHRSLVVVEIALTLTLLVAAGLMFRSYAVVMQTDPGLDRSGLLTMMVSLADGRYPDDHQLTTFFEDALAGFRALPGVQAASATTSLPAARQGAFRSFSIEGQPVAEASDYPRAHRVVVEASYFDTVKTRLVRGRLLRSADDESAHRVAVVNQTLAGQYWPAGDAIGARIRPVTDDPAAAWIEIVGIVGDVKNNGLHRPTWPAVYLPLTQQPVRELNLVVRSDAGASELVASLRSVIRELDSGLPMYRVMSMQQIFDNRFWGETLSMKLFLWCGLGALMLAIVGIYGVISYSVSQRTHEMGVRIALGARAAGVLSLVVRQGLGLAAAGIAAGLLMGLGMSRGLSFMLYGVDGNDPVTYPTAVALVATVATLASYVPARRATRVDPIVTLRDE